jgi:very-short-patch-repair endonuclease
MTVAEKILWERLKNRQVNNMHFRRQHPFGIYIIDFYCHKASLAIEIDGKIHLRTRDKDNERSEYLRSSGLKVLRFKNEEVENNLDLVINEIRKYLFLNTPPPDIITDDCK